MKYAPGESVYSFATRFPEKRKIQFVHFRDVDGLREPATTRRSR
jgi:hypothetical protein